MRSSKQNNSQRTKRDVLCRKQTSNIKDNTPTKSPLKKKNLEQMWS